MIFWQSGAPSGQGCWELTMYFSFMQASMYVTSRDCMKEHQFLVKKDMGRECEVDLFKSLLVTVPRRNEMQKGLLFVLLLFFSAGWLESGKCLLASPSTPSSFVFTWDFYLSLLRKVDCLNFDALVPFPGLSFSKRNFQPVITCRLMSL